MDINWTELLNQIQDLRAQLEIWGVTYELLMGLGAAALILLFMSLREIVVWYMRISQLQAQMVQMSQQLAQLQSSVNKVQETVEQQAEAAPPAEPLTAVTGPSRTPVFRDALAAADEDDGQAQKKKNFRLDH